MMERKKSLSSPSHFEFAEQLEEVIMWLIDGIDHLLKNSHHSYPPFPLPPMRVDKRKLSVPVSDRLISALGQGS